MNYNTLKNFAGFCSQSTLSDAERLRRTLLEEASKFNNQTTSDYEAEQRKIVERFYDERYFAWLQDSMNAGFLQRYRKSLSIPERIREEEAVNKLPKQQQLAICPSPERARTDEEVTTSNAVNVSAPATKDDDGIRVSVPTEDDDCAMSDTNSEDEEDMAEWYAKSIEQRKQYQQQKPATVTCKRPAGEGVLYEADQRSKRDTRRESTSSASTNVSNGPWNSPRSDASEERQDEIVVSRRNSVASAKSPLQVQPPGIVKERRWIYAAHLTMSAKVSSKGVVCDDEPTRVQSSRADVEYVVGVVNNEYADEDWNPIRPTSQGKRRFVFAITDKEWPLKAMRIQMRKDFRTQYNQRATSCFFEVSECREMNGEDERKCVKLLYGAYSKANHVDWIDNWKV